MSRVSPTAEAFRAAFRRPLLTFAEITWRWVVGATATLLFFFGLIEYLDTLPVTNADILFLRTRNPFLVSQAIAHILRGSLARGVLSLLLAALLLALIWIVAASLGRIATVEALLDHFRDRFALLSPNTHPEGAAIEPAYPGRFGSLLRLNFLRVVVFLAMILGFASAALLAGASSPPSNPRPGLAFFLFVPIASAVGLIGFELNWLLSLAAIFVVRDGDDAIGAIVSAVGLCRDRYGTVLAVSTWTGLAHLIVFTGASSIVSIPFALTGALPWRAVALMVIMLTLVYLAVADWLYTVRLAGYVCIAEMPDALLAPPPPPSIPVAPAPSETIDRNELILSDVPQPAIG